MFPSVVAHACNSSNLESARATERDFISKATAQLVEGLPNTHKGFGLNLHGVL